MKRSFYGLIACAAVAAGSFNVAGAQAPAGRPDRVDSLAGLSETEEQGSTVPSQEVELAFSIPGLISEVKVKNGDVIKAGDVLALQDTSVEEAALAREEFLFKSNVQARAAEAQRDLSKAKLARAQKLYDEGAGSQLELDEATLQLKVDELKMELAAEETQAKHLEIVKLKKQIERMQIVSRMDGVVRKVEAAPGEVSDPQKPSIVVVSNNPLWVESSLPTEVTDKMELGQTIQVRYTGEKKWRNARIIFFDPVADARVGKQLVRLEMPNPDNRRAGYEMVVKLPEVTAQAKAAK